MKKLRCDKPYDLDEARKKKGLPRRKRKDSRTTAYELTIRIPKSTAPISRTRRSSPASYSPSTERTISSRR